MSGTSGQPRSIDPKLREAALEAARRHGIPLGDWLSNALGEDGAPPEPANQDEQTAPVDVLHPDAVKRIADALERLAQRVDSGERRSSLLLTDIDRSMADLSVRVQDTELGAREQTLRVIAALGEVRTLQETLSARIAAAEAEPAATRALAALRDLDARLGQIAKQAEAAEAASRSAGDLARGEAARRADAIETRLSDALNGMRASVNAVEARIEAAERAAAQAREAAREAVAPLAAQVEGLEAKMSARAAMAAQEAIAPLSARLAAFEEEARSAVTRIDERLAAVDGDTVKAFGALGASVERALQRSGLAIGENAPSPEALARGLAAVESRVAGLVAESGERERLKSAIAAFDRRLAESEARGREAVAEARKALASEAGAQTAAALAELERRLQAAERRTLQTAEATSAEIRRLSDALDQGLSALAERAPAGLDPADLDERFANHADQVTRGLAKQLNDAAERQEAQLADVLNHVANRIAEVEARDTAERDALAARVDSVQSSADSLAAMVAELEARGAAVAAQAQALQTTAPPAPAPAAARPIEEPAKPAFPADPFAAPPIPAAPSFAFPQQQSAAADETKDDPAAGDLFWTLDPPKPPAEPAPPPAKEGGRPDDYLAAARRAARAAAAAQAAPAARPHASSTSPKGRTSSAEKKNPARTVLLGVGAVAVVAGGAYMLTRGGERAPTEPAPATAAPQAATISIEDAAAGGDPRAQYQLGLAKLKAGAQSEALSLLRRAAAQGLAPAQFELGLLFERGEAVEADMAEAQSWMERAAAGGNRLAMHALGVYAATGQTGGIDEATAFRWFRQAAEFGVVDSQFNLGLMYQQGRGAPADVQEALFWFLVAARGGDGQAQVNADDQQSRLRPEQVERIKARADRFTPKPFDQAANGEFGDLPWAAPTGAANTPTPTPAATTPEPRRAGPLNAAQPSSS